jgi:hypothetical protein
MLSLCQVDNAFRFRLASSLRSDKGISPTNGSGLASFAYLLCFERLPVGIGDMKTETQQEPCQQVDACQNLGVLEAPASRAADSNMRRMLTRRPLRFTSLQWLCGLESAIRTSLRQPLPI